MIHITSNNVWILFCTNSYKHSIILYNGNHERRCSGDLIEKIITPLTVDLLKYERKCNYTLIVLEMESFDIHRLPIEIGRWQNIERNNRECVLCDTNTVGDEFHYILQCRYFEQSRKNLIQSYFRNRQNVLKFKNIMTVTKKSDLLKLCKMIKVINEGVCAPG